MIASLVSSLSAFEQVALAFVVIGGILVFYALRIKGDVSAELSHGKTTLKIDAKDRRGRRRP